MSRYIFILLSALLVISSAAPALAENSVIAKVNELPITSFELNEEFQTLLPLEGSYHGGISAEKIEEIRKRAVNNLIDKELQYQSALKNGLSIPNSDINKEWSKLIERFGSKSNLKNQLKKIGLTEDQVRHFIKKRLLVIKVKEKLVLSKAMISEEEIKEHYQKNKNSFKMPMEFKASHILVGVEPSASADEKAQKKAQAQELVKRARSGEDFAQLAMKYSTDPGSAPVGGELRKFHGGVAAEEIDKALNAMKPGDISDIVETLYGFHIIKLIEVKPEVQLQFDDVKNDLHKKLEKKRAGDLYNAWMTDLKAKAKIEMLD